MDNFNKYYTSGGLSSEEAKCIYNLIKEYNISSIVEIGCGTSSTQLFLDCVNELFTYEDNQEWANTVSKKFNHNITTYTPGELNITETPDLIFIDGPAGSMNRESSFISAINKSKYVIAHDAHNKYIPEYINNHYLKNNQYKKIEFSHPNPSSGIIFVEKNEK